MLKMLKTLFRINYNHTLRVHLIMILGNIFNIYNT